MIELMKEIKNTIGVSIVCYKTDPQIIKNIVKLCLEEAAVGRICIVNNSSDIPIVIEDIADSEEGRIQIIENQNTGYVAHNIAINTLKKHKLPFHLVLNADISFERGTIDGLCALMIKNHKIGLVMPKVIYPDGTDQRLAKFLPNPLSLFLRLIGLSKIRFFDISKPSAASGPVFVPYVSGCFMFTRMSVIDEVGLMDERFFMYGEDIDWSRRIASKSDTVFIPYFQVSHEYGRGSKKELRLFWIHLLNVIIYFNKWGWFLDKDRARLNARCGEFVNLVM